MRRSMQKRQAREEAVPVVVRARPEHPHAPHHIIRTRNLGKLFKACDEDIERMAEILVLPIRRIRDIIDGDVTISNDLAMHIEMQAGLPEGWLDLDNPEVPQAFMKRAHPDAAQAVEEAPVVNEVVEPVSEEPLCQPVKRLGRPFTVSFEVSEARREALRKALDARGKGSRVALAQEIGTDISVVSSWLSGRRRITDQWAQKIAVALPEADMVLNAEKPKAEASPVHHKQVVRKATKPVMRNMGLSVDAVRAMVENLVRSEQDGRKLAKALAALLSD